MVRVSHHGAFDESFRKYAEKIQTKYISIFTWCANCRKTAERQIQLSQIATHRKYLRTSFKCTNCNHKSRQTHKVRIHGDKNNATPLAKEKTPSQWINLTSSTTPSRSELARQTHKLRIQAANKNVTPLGKEKTPLLLKSFSKTPSRPELARQTHKLRILAAMNNVTPLGKEKTPSLLKSFSKTPSHPELARQTHKLRIQAAKNNAAPLIKGKTPSHSKKNSLSITNKTPSRPEFRTVAANKTPSLLNVKECVSDATFKSKNNFKRASREGCKNGTCVDGNSHLTEFHSANLPSPQNIGWRPADNTTIGLFTSVEINDNADQQISIPESVSTVYDEAEHNLDENGNCEGLGSSIQMDIDTCQSAPIEMGHTNEFPIDRESPPTAEKTLHQLNQTYIIRNCKRFRPSSTLVESDLDSTNDMQTGTFEPNETTLGNPEQIEYSAVTNISANLIESAGKASKKPPASLWPSIETCLVRLQTVRDFSLPAFLRAENAHPPCDCCLCKFSNKNKSLTVEYCIKHPIQVRKCERNAPYAKNYRKTVLCNACRLSLNDRITKKSKGKFKCYHETCRQVFNTKSAVISHVMDHMKLKNYLCELCPNKFKSLSALKTHARKHLRESSPTTPRQ